MEASIGVVPGILMYLYDLPYRVNVLQDSKWSGRNPISPVLLAALQIWTENTSLEVCEGMVLRLVGHSITLRHQGCLVDMLIVYESNLYTLHSGSEKGCLDSVKLASDQNTKFS